MANNKILHISIDEEEFQQKKIPEQLTIIYRVVCNVEKRVRILESKTAWNKVAYMVSGIIAGVGTVFLKLKFWD